jgi:ATP-dependent helicase/nuclease subunit B
VLLRLLREPRGRDAYLTAVRRWAEQQQPGLEDEQAEESRRQRTHELAKLCGPFLQRFFRAWDAAPAKAPLAQHLDWLRSFTDDLGLVRAAAEDRRDHAGLKRLWEETETWRERDGGTVLDRRTFLRRLNAVAAEAGLPRTPFGPGRVRVLSANLAQQLHAPYVFVMGLGERSFPRLTAPHSLLDDAQRQRLQQAGIALPLADDALAGEMLLFYQVVTSARQLLTLSYPAVDERGQGLLPSSFLASVLDGFGPGAVPTLRRNMLLQGFETDVPLSVAEYRVRLAAVCRGPELLNTPLPDDLRANLADAADLMRLRFREKEHNAYDGRLQNPAVVAQLRQLFGPAKVFSPTALEDYVACPFRFFLGHVLHLEPLDEPSEEIEVTRRGQAVHRALARLHRNLKEQGVHLPGEVVDALVLQEIQQSVDEDVHRAPSLASKELWKLEGRRLLRTAKRYGGQWQKFLKPWHERGVAPQPHYFEVDFGLPAAGETVPHPPLLIKAGEIEVRVSGRIDRVDLAETAAGVGFWVIDYKTGRSAHYTSNELAEFRRLQLTLYALAVEEVLLRDREARPLGLAYWLVNEDGPKVVLPARNQVLWLDETQRWRVVRERLQSWVVTLATHIRHGVFPLRPRSENCTQTCDFGQICRITQARAVGKQWELPLPVVEG